MENHFKTRPSKKIYPPGLQKTLRNKAIEIIKSKFLPDNQIIKIILIGSSVKGEFGEYDPPGFRGSLYSDFDFIVFVKDDYIIPGWLIKEPEGKPFPDDKLNLAYREKNFVDDKYDAEIFFIREKNAININIRALGEKAGIPMTNKTKHKYIVVYCQSAKS